jgi:predicted nucleotidyltransferase
MEIALLAKFQQKYPNIYIGGSVSLILQGIIPYRIPKDIDIISTNRIHIYDLFEVKKEKRRIKTYKHSGLKFDLFINPNAQYVEHIYDGHILKLSPVDEVYQWKLKKENIVKEKHINDLKYYNEKYY